MPFRDPKLPPKGISKPFTPPTAAQRSPEDNLTLWQWMTVSWLAPLIQIGNKRQLHPEDVWTLPYEFQHRHLHDAFSSLRGSVVHRLLRANWIDLVILCLLSLVELVGSYTLPLILQQLLKSMQRISVEKSPAIFWALITLAIRYVVTQSAVFNLWYARRAYERCRGELITMIYEKTLHRKIQGGIVSKESVGTEAVDLTTGPNDADQEPFSEAAEIDAGEDTTLLNGIRKEHTGVTSRVMAFVGRLRKIRSSWRSKKEPDLEQKKPASMGKILNMMRNDAYEVAQRFWEFPSLLNQPLGFILSFALTWRLLGWPCVFGIAVVVVVQVLNGILAKILVSWETTRRKATDAKLQQISQYIEAIRHLRLYAWQQTWLDKVMSARQKELNLKIITSLWNSIILYVNAVGSSLLPIAAFWAYTTLTDQKLTVDVAFPALELFQRLQDNLRAIPQLITVLLNAAVAVGRIEDFMKEPNKVEEEAEGMRFGEEFSTKNASFAWPGTTASVLKDVTVAFPLGLTVIYGQVAAGKTALLQALLGELDLLSGELVRPSSAVAYCSQTPWLQSMSIRENILFNGPFDEARYKQVLHACALVPDLSAFEHGDLSPIGENGIGLSGGQKMRVALARALYSRASILLLDDPLSALDQQTAEHIVKHCLRGALAESRTLVLVTHRVDICTDCAEQLIEIKDGVAKSSEGRGNDFIGTSLSPVVSRKDGDSETDKAKDRDEAAAIPEKFEEEETRVHGGVQARVYWQYVKAGRMGWWAAVILSLLLCRTFIVGQAWFFKEWSEAYKDTALRTARTPGKISVFLASESTPVSRLFDRFPNPATNPNPWLIGLLVICLLESFFFLTAMTFTIILSYVASKRLFKTIMQKVSSTAFRYYDVTPTGRLMNRLTSDMGTVDGGIPDVLTRTAWYLVIWVFAVISIAFVTPWFLVAVVMLTLTFVMVFLQFIPTSQSLRRLEMVSLSPLMSNFGALLEGLMTVRAFCAQKQFQDRIIFTTDAFQQMDHFYWSLQSWLMIRFDLLSAFSTLALTLLAIYSNLSAGLTAFVLLSAEKFVLATHSACKSYGTLQLDFVAVERVIELLHLDQEDPGKVEPPASWPSTKDDVVFEEVTMKYAPHLDPALKELSFTIPGGSSAAVIGRTGSGKSTMALALLGTTPPSSGRILIGGIDISKVDKHALRSRVTFLAQDPILFPGSLRHNLDPTGEHTDHECSAVLERVCGSYGFTLETEIDSGGKNLSQGQRQLVGLARAILRRSTIVIMDEATASIDRETAWEIQRVLKEELAGSTVITIAHRPSAVRGADLCLKLANGRLEAQGKPEEVVPGDAQGSSSADQDDI
ncbi:ABC bile acid transporter [Myriangium duriaei CBS 260.36]|uniref:ABC bile acid transporter n=1 Tax=Myriangium duriaei CBS 260.36 TaxID=1168546 RepID=A0A9P4J1U5_9PEZI|nr:ABC bile acid transporter [Myriangium duriaei CBS 260.36]